MNIESLNLSTSRGATTAYVARPEGPADTAVVLIHEWWGINEHIRDLAGRFAMEGYLCVAPDLYRGRVACHLAKRGVNEIRSGNKTARSVLTRVRVK
jgi:dienelactone hydrolase